jgi:hypothetical protein
MSDGREPDRGACLKAVSGKRKRGGRRIPNGDEDAQALDPAALVRELNHRVKNNLQIVVSLMNLRKRMLPPDRRQDIRFIEEHVQSMAVAYRLGYATGLLIEVSLKELITEVLLGLRQIAGLDEEFLRIEAPEKDAMMGLDHAVALASYLAVLLPPWLDEAARVTGAVTITVTMAGNFLTLSVRGTWNRSADPDILRSRLMQAYARQLKAELVSGAENGSEQIRFMLEGQVAGHVAAGCAS